jgi:uncharacterized protein (TIGR01244 family)
MTSLRVRFAAVMLIAAAVGACHVAPPDPNAPRRLTDDVSISGQISVADVKSLKAKGFRAIINMRPDDESPDQSKYAQLQNAAREAQLDYGYAPVKSGASIPANAPKTLNYVLEQMPKPVLVFADTPDHAAQVWALAEASRAGGLDAAAIMQAVKAVGLNADGLATQISARIARRPKR